MAAICGNGDPAIELVDTVVATVQHEVTVFKFNGLALVEPVTCLGADMPGLAVIVTVQDVAVVGLRAAFGQGLVIARDDETPPVRAALQLDASARAGCVPTPVR